MSTLASNPSGKVLAVSLWTVQVLLAVFFVYGGITKLFTPATQLAEMMPWTANYPVLVLITGIADLLGGLGILLPSATRIQPRLTLLAGWGLIVLQILALGFHLMRGEAMVAPMNVILLALIGFVVWGRAKALPIPARP